MKKNRQNRDVHDVKCLRRRKVGQWVRSFKSAVFFSAVIVASLITSVPSSSQQRYEQDQYEGHLGDRRIGLTVIHDGDRIDGGHYFYQRFLRDIAITGSKTGPEITLIGSDGGTFLLHFIGNGSDGGQPLGFDNSVGLDGTWTDGGGTKTYPVSLRETTSREGLDNGRRYRDVTNESDVAFEGRVQSFLRAALSSDKTTAVRLISYPLEVNGVERKHRQLRNSAEVLAAWNDLFTPALLAKLADALPHDMFVRNGLAMVGDGEAWFDAHGLSSLNIP